MTAFVVDASVVAAWCLDEQPHGRSEQLLHSLVRGGRATAPSIWLFEVANILRTALRQQRVTEAELSTLRRLISSLRVEIAHEPPARIFDAILPLATRHDLTVYDAAYLDLSLREGLPLATLDQELAAAAKAAGVEVL